MIKDNKKRRKSWTTIRRYITQEQMKKNTVDKNSKEKYEKGVNVKWMEMNTRIRRPQKRREIHGRNNWIRRRRKCVPSLHYRHSKGQALPTTCHEGTQRKKKYSSTLSFIFVLDGGGWLSL
jgi:hypothetical protein